MQLTNARLANLNLASTASVLAANLALLLTYPLGPERSLDGASAAPRAVHDGQNPVRSVCVQIVAEAVLRGHLPGTVLWLVSKGARQELHHDRRRDTRARGQPLAFSEMLHTVHM